MSPTVFNLDFTALPQWEKIPGWFALYKAIVLQRAIKRLPEGAVIVELGSYQGRSSVAIAAVLPPGGKLYCVDHFLGSAEHQQSGLDLSNLYQAFRSNIEQFGVQKRVTVLAKAASEAAGEFADGGVDLLFVDAAHDFESVKADLDAWYRKLKPGGWLVCDDYDPVHWPGVVQAVAKAGLIGTTPVPNLWFHQK